MQYLSARAQDVAGLESTISELGSLFGRLASVVAEQGAQVERIDADLEAATGDMDRGQAQLQVRGSRGGGARLWGAACSLPE
jgi:syntaxin 5